MKESEYNEIDRLLRSLAAGRGSLPGNVVGVEASAEQPHLDADELNSYAEGALPPATRARYSSHLADCDDCRRLVTQLAIASGSVLKEDKKSPQPATAKWKQIIAALFTPVVMRYAMPVVALVVVGTIAFLGWQQRKDVVSESAQLADRQTSAPILSRPSGAAPAGNASPRPHAIGEPDQKAAQPQTGPGSASKPAPPPATNTMDSVSEKPADKKAEAASDRPLADASREKDSESAPPAQRTYAPDPAAAAPTKPAETELSKQPAKAGENKQEDRIESRSAKTVAPKKEPAKSQPEEGQSNGAVAASGTTDGKNGGGAKSKLSVAGRRDAARGTDDESESRTVSGRRFQHRNGAWVDTAYNSSTATTNVTRGSEQYRALIADEPGIDAIAKQLDGQVILVWKGRAYRIR